MAKLFFGAENCKAATSALTGRRYDADRQGFIHVSDPADAAYLKAGGYIEAGGLPKLKRYWVCDGCNWDAVFNHCSKCGSTELRKVEK